MRQAGKQEKIVYSIPQPSAYNAPPHKIVSLHTQYSLRGGRKSKSVPRLMPRPHHTNPPHHKRQGQHADHENANPGDDLRLQELMLLGVLEILGGDLVAVLVSRA